MQRKKPSIAKARVGVVLTHSKAKGIITAINQAALDSKSEETVNNEIFSVSLPVLYLHKSTDNPHLYDVHNLDESVVCKALITDLWKHFRLGGLVN